jgi:23S rRNA (cytosine1962-C5)-methyltransferase
MLDAFCYTGGFALHAARAGAGDVTAIDSSAPALELARQNAALNGLDRVNFVQADVFGYLTNLVRDDERFGMIVLDPPKFARSRSAVPEALRGYRRLQALALRLLEPDGVLVTCCCTGLITMDMLDGLQAEVAAEVGRDVQILERRGQAADHPVAVTCLESGYLKCLIARVA